MSLSLSPTRSRADRFAALLEQGGRSDDPVLAPLLTLAGALQALPAGPRPEFRDTLRQRLVAVAVVTAPVDEPGVGERVRAWVSSWRTQRRVALAAGGLAAVTAVAGVSVSASRSLPGDPFYAIKSAAERVQLAATSGDLDRGKVYLAFARTRLREVDALAHRTPLSAGVSGEPLAAGTAADTGTASRIVSTLRTMDGETRAGTADLTRAWHRSGSAEPITILATFAQRQAARLAAVLPELPAAAQAQADQSMALLRGVDVVVTRMRAAGCGSCTTPGGVPRTGVAPGAANGGASAPGTASKPGAGHGGTGPGPSVPTIPGTGGVGPAGGGSGQVPPQVGSSSSPLPVPTLSPVPAPPLNVVPAPTLSTPLPGLSPSAITSLVPLPGTGLGLP